MSDKWFPDWWGQEDPRSKPVEVDKFELVVAQVEFLRQELATLIRVTSDMKSELSRLREDLEDRNGSD